MEPKIIKLDPPLPCGIFHHTDSQGNTVTCQNPARVAHAYPAAPDAPNLPDQPPGLARPGEWVILPVCEECTRRSVQTYGAAA